MASDAKRDADRLRALEAKLAKATAPEAPPAVDLGRQMNQANVAWRMVIELVAGLVIGFGIGWGLDWLLGTRPLMLVAFVLAGLAAGVKTMLRTARELAAPPPPNDDNAPRGPDEDED